MILTDQEARTRIDTQLDRQLFVEAGAGSGKTFQLVGRICALVAAGEELAGIAAITFTEKAAAELRSLIQDDLRDGKIASARTVLETLSELPPNGRRLLEDEQAKCFLGSLNDMRLAWGTALDVTEELDLGTPTGDEAVDSALSQVPPPL